MPGFMQTSHIAVHMEDKDYLKSLPDDWYSSDYYADKLIGYLNDRNEQKDDRPFFGYLAFTAPHWPLQAPKELIAHYKGCYDTGPEGLRQSRLQKMVDLKLMGEDIEPHPIVGDEVKDWESMTPDERAKSSKAMEAYAGMVEVSGAKHVPR
jgi:arylsulfatase A-like enzyme